MSDDKHLTIFDYAERALSEVVDGVNSALALSWRAIRLGIVGKLAFDAAGVPKIKPEPNLKPLTYLSVCVVASGTLLLLGGWGLDLQTSASAERTRSANSTTVASWLVSRRIESFSVERW